jgi:hypothetical protein
MISWKVDITCARCGVSAEGVVEVKNKPTRGAFGVVEWLQEPQPVRLPPGWKLAVVGFDKQEVCSKC